MICTIHHYVCVKEKQKHPSFILSVTLFAVQVKYKKICFFTKMSVYLVLAYKQYHKKCSVYVLYISAPQVMGLGTKAHSPNSCGGRNTAASPTQLE